MGVREVPPEMAPTPASQTGQAVLDGVGEGETLWKGKGVLLTGPS